jgi:hypothetical protein
MLIIVVGCSLRDSDFTYAPNKPKPDTRNPPLYPGAQQIKEESHEIGLPDPERWIRFYANDPPSEVLAFYVATLRKAGWEPSPVTAPAGTLYFSWSNGAKNPVYSLTVTVKMHNTDQTEVQLQIRTLPPE